MNLTRLGFTCLATCFRELSCFGEEGNKTDTKRHPILVVGNKRLTPLRWRAL